MSIATLQELMGHKRKETTLKYIHLARTNLRKEMVALNVANSLRAARATGRRARGESLLRLAAIGGGWTNRKETNRFLDPLVST